MFLANKTISKYIQKGKIKVGGKLHIETHGITVNLGDEILIPKAGQVIDIENPIELEYDKHDLNKEPYTLKPNGFILAGSQQSVQTSRDIITILDGRSTFARLGMTIHVSAMMLDGTPFSKQTTVLEIKNLGNFDIVLHKGEPIGTYFFAKMTEKVVGEKKTRYPKQNGVLPPVI